ncbi:MAG: hypothetical protein DMF82_01110 [Acidobacteria bacterium]|nr:MAG: hypothetical protein DMF82_01110 [Acidobacteriota bacterium]
MTMRVRLLPVAAALVAGGIASAQTPSQTTPATARPRPPAAARETVSATLNGKVVAIDYGRPALNGRKVDELIAQLPPDRVWRAGANEVTTLKADTDVLIGGKRVPAGKYSVYVYAPASGDWSLILNTDPGVPLKTIFPAAPPERADHLWPILDGYAKIASKEVIRVPMKQVPAKEPMDRFLISLEPAKAGASAITLTWGDRAWTVDVKDAGKVSS